MSNFNISAVAQKIKLVVFDVDGVMTDGKLYYSSKGEELKVFHVHDGHGIKALLNAGIEVAIISSRNSKMVEKRFTELGVRFIYQGQADKTEAFNFLLASLKLEPTQVCYVGDDEPDLAFIQQVGLGIAVANAVPIVKQHAHYQTQLKGGHGAVREVCELILAQQKNSASQLH